MGSLGVGVISFNRPGYLRRVLASLEAQTQVDDAEYWLFQDGAVNRFSGVPHGKQEDVEACRALFDRARLPNKHVTHWPDNVGVAINSLEALDTLSDNYARVILLEGDAVLSPHWLRLAGLLFDDLAARPNVFSVSPNFRSEGPDADAVRIGRRHMWAECFLAERWHAIRPYYIEDYWPHVCDRDYFRRDTGAINATYATRGVTGGPGGLAWSQDGGRQLAMMRAGMQRSFLEVNRAISIGREGIHFTPALFHERGFDFPGPFIHEADATRGGFTWPA